MPVTLAESKNNSTTDYDPTVIDEFRKESTIADSLIFDNVVSPQGGGGLVYGYRRLVTQATADTRAINTEYTPQEVSTVPVVVNLAVMGGSFQVDRVLAGVGPAVSGVVALNTNQKIKAAGAKFADLVINGDTATDAAAFDGLNKALAGSATEFRPNTVTDWSDMDTDPRAQFKALDLVDQFLSMLDGRPTVILGNAAILAKLRGIVRRSGQYVANPVDGLLNAAGAPVIRESFGGVIFGDPGTKAGSNNPIIPTLSRDMDNAVFTVTETGTPTGGTFTVTVAISGGTTFTSAPIAQAATGATIQGILAAMPNVGTGNVTVTGSAGGPFTVTFTGSLQYAGVTLTLGTNGLTGGTTPAVTFVNSGTGAVQGLTDLYAYRVGLDGFHGVSMLNGQIVKLYPPDFTIPGAVKTGEVEIGPVAVALKATKSAAVWRNIKVA